MMISIASSSFSKGTTVCGTCGGTGFVINETVRGVKITPEGAKSPYTENTASLCPVCNRHKEDKNEELIERSGIPTTMRFKTLSDFSFNIYKDKITATKVKKLITGLVNDLDNWLLTGQGLYLSSEVNGSGKTLLACCIANECIHKGKTVRFLRLCDLTKNSTNEENENFRNLKTADLLIIDEFDFSGSNKYQEWQMNLLFDIVDYRVSNNRPILITSNCELKAIKIKNNVKSRLLSTLYKVHFPEEDIRLLISEKQKKEYLNKIKSEVKTNESCND